MSITKKSESLGLINEYDGDIVISPYDTSEQIKLHRKIIALKVEILEMRSKSSLEPIFKLEIDSEIEELEYLEDKMMGLKYLN